MDYTAKDIDVEKFEQELDQMEKYAQFDLQKQIAKVEARAQGYTDAIREVRQMLHCSNFEREKL